MLYILTGERSGNDLAYARASSKLLYQIEILLGLKGKFRISAISALSLMSNKKLRVLQVKMKYLFNLGLKMLRNDS